MVKATYQTGSITWMFHSPQGRVYSEHRVAPSLRGTFMKLCSAWFGCGWIQVKYCLVCSGFFCIIACITTTPLIFSSINVCACVCTCGKIIHFQNVFFFPKNPSQKTDFKTEVHPWCLKSKKNPHGSNKKNCERFIWNSLSQGHGFPSSVSCNPSYPS